MPRNPNAFYVIVAVKCHSNWKPPLIILSFCFLQDLVKHTYCPVQRKQPLIQLHIEILKDLQQSSED